MQNIYNKQARKHIYRIPTSVKLHVFTAVFCVVACLFLSQNKVFAGLAPEFYQLDSIQNNPNEVLIQIIARAEAAWKDNDTEIAASNALKGFAMLRGQQVADSVYAELLHVYGKILIDQQSNQQGIDSLLKSIRFKIKAFNKNHKSLSKTYNYIGISYFQMREYVKANKYYKMSTSILVKNGLWGANLFDSYLNIGIVEAVQGKYDLAFSYFDTTRMVLDSIGLAVDSMLVARFYINYGTLATLNGKLDEGNRFFNIAESIFNKKYGESFIRTSDINFNKGLNSYFNYDFKKAELYYKKALEIYKENNNVEDRISRAYVNLASVNLKLDHYDQAIQYSKMGLEFEMPDELKWLHYSNLAQAYIAKNDEENALTYFNKAIDLEGEGKVSSIKKINLYIEFANFLVKKEQYLQSKNYYFEAVDLITNSFGRNAAAYAHLLSQLGYYHLATHAVDSSLYYFDNAIRIWNKAPDSSDSAIETYNEVRFAESYIGRARAYYKKYTETMNTEFLDSGSRDIKMILDRMEEVISKLDKESKLLLFEQLKPAYVLATEIAYEQHTRSDHAGYLQDVFNYMERSKNAVLLASVRNLNALKSADVPADVIQLEKQLNEEINGIRQLLADEKQKRFPEIEKISFFETKLLSLLLDHDSLVQNLEENYPRYYSLKYDRSTIQLSHLIEKLNHNEAIIEYEIADSSIYIYAITKNGILIRNTVIDSVFWNSLDYLLTVKNVDISEFRKPEIRQFYKHSNILWKQLIEPVCDLIKDKKLIIIPDGVLGYLPFGILARTTEHPGELDFKTMPYLLKEFPVSYSYSSTLKYNPYFSRKGSNNNEVIAFAPDYGRNNENPSRTGNLAFDDLPNAKQEVISIEDMWGGKLFLGENATKSNFVKKAGNYDVIHLAMHAMINDSVPMFSRLVFSESEKDTSSAFLNTYEIYDLVLNASMVTLSACNTGTGILRSGEGIMSLARGFIYAGVPSIVMTLWEVQDKSGSDIMTRYYKNLKLGFAKDVALQKAKLGFLKDSPDYSTHPFYWSAYIVTGDTQSIKSNKLPAYISLIVGMVVVIFTLILILIIRHKKRSGKTI
ncbi:MAG: CHAT domain-containing protein [Bacteroidetes bacterium]|nr:CHAT domain-containing protein [Bacteroidota bacterium]